MNTPGILLATLSNPADAKGLLKTAIRGNNPVLFVESATLYNSKSEVPTNESLTPFKKAKIKRERNNVTVVTVSRIIPEAIATTYTLKSEKISVKVIDPKTLVPLYTETIISSVKKTNISSQQRTVTEHLK